MESGALWKAARYGKRRAMESAATFFVEGKLQTVSHSSLFTLHSPFSILYSLFSILYSLFSILHSLFSILHSLFSIPLWVWRPH